MNISLIISAVLKYGPLVLSLLEQYGPIVVGWIKQAEQAGTLEQDLTGLQSGLKAVITTTSSLQELGELFQSAAPADLGNPTPAQDHWSGSHAR